jgi:hypothetical protein
MKQWFLTWDVPEYKERAKKTPPRNLLVILRREPDRYYCVKADFRVGERGLPGFNVLEELYFPAEQQAAKQITAWKK